MYLIVDGLGEPQTVSSVGHQGNRLRRDAAGRRACTKTVLKFLRRWPNQREHAHLVAKFALRLFDRLWHIHRLEHPCRMLLHAAALLHDVGKAQGSKEHHKVAQDIIMAAEELPFSDYERHIVALVARYHRRSLPHANHKLYQNLDPSSQRVVNVLASLLRLSDGLDESTLSYIEDIDCITLPHQILVRPKISDLEEAPYLIRFKWRKTDVTVRARASCRGGGLWRQWHRDG